MAHDVLMPQMGESIAEGTITTWLKKVGDQVARDEPLFEISTDKVDAEIPSPAEGTLTEIRVEAGQTVPIGQVVAVLAQAGEKPAAKPAEPTAAKSGPVTPQGEPTKPAATAPAAQHAAALPSSPAAPQMNQRGDGPRSSPLVRKIAQDEQIDVASVSGTGIGGRVTKEDILSAVAHRSEHAGPASASAGSAQAPIATSSAPARAPSAPVAMGASEVPEAYRPKMLPGDRTQELPMMRQKIAEHMVISKVISPHVATVWEIDFTHVAKLRARHKAAWQERHGVNLTYTAFIMKATVDALKAFPDLNASLDGKRVIYHQSVNLGLAVALENGLIVPVIQNADEMNLLGLARHAADLAARARTKKLKPHEVQNGTFTISNPGNFGAMFNVPVINQPQVGILGVGTVEKRAVVIDDMLAIRSRAYMSLSFDHRMVDGAMADQFMARLKKGIETLEESDL